MNQTISLTTPTDRGRRLRRGWVRSLGGLAAGATLLFAASAPAQGQDDGQTLESLRQQRSEIQARQAEQAGAVDALQASDAEAKAALATLNAEVNAQQDRVEEAERSVRQAEDEQHQAEEAQAQAQRELDAVHADLRDVAVDAYISVGGAAGDDTIRTASAGNVNDAVHMRTLLSVKAGERTDVVERYRTIQEDLEMQRAAAAEAADRARAQRQVVADRMAELDDARSRQQDYTDQLERRVDAALAEAQSLATVDAQLASTISARETQIAQAIAAQRAADEARAQTRVAQGLEPLAGGPASGGSTGAPPSIVGSGDIVTVGGIQVHSSIAGNLQALLAAAAADGVPLSGSGFRDPSEQIALRRQNCGGSDYSVYNASPSSCSPPTARPGSSMHERGLAIDFRNCGSRSTACYQWLAGNASRFGFSNLPSESWHWSTTGS